jgi:hypothetical protein
MARFASYNQGHMVKPLMPSPRGTVMSHRDFIDYAENSRSDWGDYLGSAWELGGYEPTLGNLAIRQAAIPPEYPDAVHARVEDSFAPRTVDGMEPSQFELDRFDRLGPPNVPGDPLELPPNERPYVEDEYRQSPYWREGLKTYHEEPGMYPNRAKALAEQYDHKRYLEWAYERGPDGVLSGIAGFGVRMVRAGITDPLLAVPLIGPATRGVLVAKAGAIGGRALSYGAQGAGMVAIGEGVSIPMANDLGDEIGWQEYITNVALGGLLIGAGGAAVGMYRKARFGRESTTQFDLDLLGPNGLFPERLRRQRDMVLSRSQGVNNVNRSRIVLGLAVDSVSSGESVRVGEVLAPQLAEDLAKSVGIAPVDVTPVRAFQEGQLVRASGDERIGRVGREIDDDTVEVLFDAVDTADGTVGPAIVPTAKADLVPLPTDATGGVHAGITYNELLDTIRSVEAHHPGIREFLSEFSKPARRAAWDKLTPEQQNSTARAVQREIAKGPREVAPDDVGNVPLPKATTEELDAAAKSVSTADSPVDSLARDQGIDPDTGDLIDDTLDDIKGLIESGAVAREEAEELVAATAELGRVRAFAEALKAATLTVCGRG